MESELEAKEMNGRSALDDDAEAEPGPSSAADSEQAAAEPADTSRNAEPPPDEEAAPSAREDGKPVVPVVVLIEEPILLEGASAMNDDDANKEVMNPQEASAPVSPADTATTTEPPPSETMENSPPEESVMPRKRKRRRPVRVAPVDEHDRRPMLRLPPNQYEATLRRRAIRKREEEEEEETESIASAPSSPRTKPPTSLRKSHDVVVESPVEKSEEVKDESLEQYDEEYGDISLGMKLNIIGGRVIVQAVKPLDDGRASPAQLSGMVKRGDVLLSVDHASLVNFSLDQLVEGLKPLSSPLPDGTYKRTLHLRFAMGEGMKLLEKSELVAKKDADVEGDIFSPLSQFIPMVDQLSGVPLFDDHHHPRKTTPVKAKAVVAAAQTPKRDNLEMRKESMDLDQMISMGVADQLDFDRQKYTSEFFVWDELQPELLRASLIIQAHTGEGDAIPLTRSQMVENGKQVMKGAKVVFYNVEDIDLGKDKFSLNRFSSTLSWSSSRRRYGSLAAESTSISKTPSETASVGSSESQDVDEARGDDLLLQLAARDEIWRKQLLDSLARAEQDISESVSEAETTSAESQKQKAVDPAFSLGKYLLGEQVSGMLAAKSKTHSLPPLEITSVLFDLVARLLDAPEEIDLGGNSRMESRVHMLPFHKTKRILQDDDSLLAACFLSEKALPAWLKSFRPLPWEQRRLLWPDGPSTASHGGGTHAVSDDGLTTLDSGSTGDVTQGTRARRKKTLEETIQEKELDVEARTETCYLLTFYFTREIIPNVPSGVESQRREAQQGANGGAAAVKFIERYGAYLKLHDCLVYAAVAQARNVVDSLISLAQYDLRHKEALKEISKAGVLVLYEPSMLSAILKKLQGIRVESIPGRRRDLIALCASAYPDLLPWQVREACTPTTGSSRENGEFEDLYYEYLSLLLHPSEGHERARRSCELVEEWCELSIKSSPAASSFDGHQSQDDRRNNFRIVASSTSGRHYCRNLPALLKLSMQGNERWLALDLIEQILENFRPSFEKEILSDVRSTLQTIAKDALRLDPSSKNQSVDEKILKRVFDLYDVISTYKSVASRQSIVVPEELYSLLQACEEARSEQIPSDKELALVDLLARQSTPRDALQTFALRSQRSSTLGGSLSALHTLLQRGAQAGIENELSGSLLRVNHSRRRTTRSVGGLGTLSASSGDTAASQGDIWRRMFEGIESLDK